MSDLDNAERLLAKLEENTDLVPPDPRWTLVLAMKAIIRHLRNSPADGKAERGEGPSNEKRRGFDVMPPQDVAEAWFLEVNFDGYGYRPDEVFATEELATAALQAFRGGGIAGARVRKWTAYEAGQQSRLGERERWRAIDYDDPATLPEPGERVMFVVKQDARLYGSQAVGQWCGDRWLDEDTDGQNDYLEWPPGEVKWWRELPALPPAAKSDALGEGRKA